MKRFRIVSAFVVVCLTVAMGPAVAQSTDPGLAVAIEPCPITYATGLAANVPLHLQVRGYCGIPLEASAVFLNMKAGGAAVSGKAYLWPFGGSLPSVSQFNFDPNVTPGWPHSGQALVRLRPNPATYGLDISIQSSTAVNFSVAVEGYLMPLLLP